ncbi:MshQ-like protein [Marinobacter fuscus]|uniref:MshQ-like protein n=1 Tax=Marinobacter fuscus TaxID=2109942 RepID=A0A2T1K7P4_9GAMM|nr:DUF6701 domain-containing protein [Marinobacter fuscus]PSF05542.1 MshQ-like protein [Marinobacter fuscus]
MSRQVWLRILVSLALAFWASSALALSCDEIYSSDTGINEELPKDKRLTINDNENTAPAPVGKWPAPQAWPASGTELSGGDYYFKGDELDEKYKLAVKPGEVVRIFVSGDHEFDEKSKINLNGDPSQLLLVVQGDLELGEKTKFNGVIYTTGEIEADDKVQVSGAIASEDEVDFDDDKPKFTHDPGAANSGLLDGLCSSGEPEPDPEPEPTECFTDDFSEASLGETDWVTSVAGGSFTPQVVDGRMRMTEARRNQSTAATLQRLLPGAENLVVLEFDYFAYGGNGADGIAVVFSDAKVTPQPGSYGGALGYAQRNNGTPGFAGGWLGVGIDEYGNFAANNEGKQGGGQRTRDSVTLRGSGSGASGYRYLEGTGSLSPGIDDTGARNPHRYRIVVDSQEAGQALVTVERDTGGGYQNLIGPFDVLARAGQAPVPDDFLISLTGSTGGSTNIHELDNLKVCALKLEPMGKQVDHFEFVYDGVALTCQPEAITIRACENADCSVPFTDPVEVTLQPTGWLGGDTFSFSGGQAVRPLQKTTPGSVRLDVVSSTPPAKAFSRALCDNGSGSLNPANCEVEFRDTGLAFEVPDLTSHRPQSNIQVRAVQRDDQSNACVPAFENVRKPVRFWSAYVNPGPAGRPDSRQVLVQGEPVGRNEADASVVELEFGAGGVANIEVTYPDAGQMNLNALYQGSASSNDAGLRMPGADSFVSLPAGFCVQPEGVCGFGDERCPAFRKAGQAFDVSITAVGWQSDADADLCQGNPVTPNFRLLDIPLETTLVAPAGGAQGTLLPASYSHARSLSAAEVVEAQISEVGVFEVAMTPAPGSYLGRDLPAARSRPVGRFYPDRFQVEVSPGELAPFCTGAAQSFTYTGQPFDWLLAPELTITPLSVQGEVTRNYRFPGFQKLVAPDVKRRYPDVDQLTMNLVGSAMPVLSTPLPGVLSGPENVLGSGQMLFQYDASEQFEFGRTGDGLVAPFRPALQFVIEELTDSDGVAAESAPYPFTPLADLHIRFGRWSMDNVYGPETLPVLPMPYRVEYWNGSRFETNIADRCTAWDTALINNTANYHRLDGAAAPSGSFSAGTAPALRLLPDGSQGTDTLRWQVPPWLTYDWNGDSTFDHPSGLATFGVYRGHDRVIYWQER